MKHYLLFSGLFCIVHFGFSQHEQVKENEHSLNRPFHKITLVTANSFITNHVTENSEGIFVVPTFGLNYDYFFRENWGIGIHNLVVLQQYKIERHHDETELIRNNPVAVSGVVSFKPHHRWTVFGGYGVELEKNENIFLFKFGVEYGIELRDNWELALGLDYDHKINTYSSFMFGIGFSKIFNKRN